VHAQLSQKGALQDVDETDLAIDNRLKTYRDEIDGIRGEIKSLSKYVVIDANQPLNAVTLEVLKVVEH
jgi:adenylate kinase family enzyme